MFDMAGIATGSRVLDVAAGAGDQTLLAADRVGPQGYVLATDISPAILVLAATNARDAGYRHVETQVLDGENLDVPEGAFDAVISRAGRAFRNLSPASLVPSASEAQACWKGLSKRRGSAM